MWVVAACTVCCSGFTEHVQGHGGRQELRWQPHAGAARCGICGYAYMVVTVAYYTNTQCSSIPRWPSVITTSSVKCTPTWSSPVRAVQHRSSARHSLTSTTTGGTSLFLGAKERLEREINDLSALPSKVKVMCPVNTAERRFSVWIGTVIARVVGLGRMCAHRWFHLGELGVVSANVDEQGGVRRTWPRAHA